MEDKITEVKEIINRIALSNDRTYEGNKVDFDRLNVLYKELS